MGSPAPTTEPLSSTQEALEFILGIYPILESILSSSHRVSIHHLGRTCHSIRITLSTWVDPLVKPFPNCMEGKQRCRRCQTSACIDCKMEVVEIYKPAVLFSHDGRIYTMLAEHSLALDTAVHSAIQRAEERGILNNSYVFTGCKKERIYFCQSCFPRVGQVVPSKEPEWVGRSIMHTEKPSRHTIDPVRGLAVTDLVWGDVPHPDSECTCSELFGACVASVHCVPVVIEKVQDEAIVFAWLPQKFCNRVDGEAGQRPYIVDKPSPRVPGIIGWDILRIPG